MQERSLLRCTVATPLRFSDGR
ncbi:MAG: hypothetical protein K0S45_3529, partial [Nitrospira sp.]|nr:hypothetical protein [Nitrospira sp.]